MKEEGKKAMLTLILLVCVVVLILLGRHKYTKLLASIFMVFFLVAIISFAIEVGILVELISNADTPQKYAEAQEKVVSLQSEIQDLKDSYSEKEVITLIVEYTDLAKQLEENENYIKKNQQLVEEGLSKDRFLLYFGG